MKILTRLVFFIIAVFVILSSIFYSANKGLLDAPLKHVLQYYLWTKNINLSFANMKFKDGTIKASNVKFIIGEGIGLIKDIEIHADISGDITAPKLSVKLLPNNMLVLAKDSNRIIEAKLSAELNSDLFGKNKNYELNIEDIAFDNTGEIKQDEVKQGNAYCKYEGGNVDCKLNLSDSSYITLGNMDANSNKIEINARNIPLKAYEIAYPFLPKNNTLEFFRDTIQSGNLEEAKVEFDPSIKSLYSNLFGIVKIRNVDFSYDEWFPMIKDMDIDAEINGTKLNASVNSAYSSDILISQGVIKMDWQGIEDTVLTIDAKGKGSAYSLADFILTEQHEKMKQANIDFRAVKGNAEVNIDIKIPFSPRGENSYNITADITDASLNIFKDAIRFENAQISGKFDGFRVTLSGKGSINNFENDLNFTYNLYNHSEFNHRLNVKANFKAAAKEEKTQDQKIGFVTLLGGDTILDSSYINKDSQGVISAISDLTNLDLYFDKLGIHKASGDKALLTINAKFDDINNGVMDFSVEGKKNLQIHGNGTICSDKFQAEVTEIKHKQTDLSGSISLNGDSMDLHLNGKLLDISNADMIQFLEKERDGGATNLKLNIDKIKLKNNVWMNNVKANFECDNNRCFSGELKSKIGKNKNLDLKLSADDLHENWIIKCDNAGACLSGIGAYNSMKSGALLININTSRKEVKSGQIIPILSGNFALKRFVLRDTPMITKFISFVSLPGIIDIIRGNNSIVFADMKGDFSFNNKLLTVKDALATGPYFNFNMHGDIDIKNKYIDIKGYITPSLYGVKSVLDIVPLVGSIFTGTRKSAGLMSAPYRMREHY